MRYANVIIGLLLGLFVSAAFAQELTEPQKRRLHLPYIRAATDCYARAISANTSALDMAREGRWYDALSATGNACNASVLTMINEHDRLYGPGTGATFFKGPYVEDLPRAVSTRLKDALARRSAEVEQANTARNQHIDEGERTRDLLRDRMYTCTRNELTNLVTSSEGAEILATAAMTICSREVDAALSAAMDLVRLQGGVTSDSFRDELRDIVKKNVVTNAVQMRAAAKKQDSTPQTSPVAAQPPVTRATNIRTPEECLKLASALREGQIIAQEKLISMMLDICRPEIENVARSKFLADPTQQLSDLRAQALESAVKDAKQIIHAQ